MDVVHLSVDEFDGYYLKQGGKILARYTGPVCRLCRREGAKLYLKGARCLGKSCSFVKRSYTPGQHGLNGMRKKISEYGIQFREKQKAKRIYAILEKQFRNYYKKAEQMEGVAGDNLLIILEERLDNVVYRLGFARSRAEARQLVRHKSILVNSKFVNIPSYAVKVGDTVEVKNSQNPTDRFKLISEVTDSRIIPEWLNVDGLKGIVVSVPQISQIDSSVDITLVIELYSK
jgi:small subunit ribosomal protein S4